MSSQWRSRTGDQLILSAENASALVRGAVGVLGAGGRGVVGGEFFSGSYEGGSAIGREAVNHHCDGLLRRRGRTHGLVAQGAGDPVFAFGCGLDVRNVPCPWPLCATAEMQLAHSRPGEQLAQARLSVGRFQQFRTDPPVSANVLPPCFDAGVARRGCVHGDTSSQSLVAPVRQEWQAKPHDLPPHDRGPATVHKPSVEPAQGKTHNLPHVAPPSRPVSRRPAPDSERPLVNRSANPARLRERCVACTFELVTTRRRNARVRSAHPPRGDRPWSERDQSTFGDRPRPVRAYSARGALSACRVRPTEALDRPVELVEDVAALCVKQLQHRATLPARPDQRRVVEAVHRGAWRDLPNATGRGRGRGRAARGGVRHRHPQGRAGRPARAHFVPGRQRLRLLITLHPTRQAAAP